MLLYGFLQSFDINPCPMKYFYNTCELIKVSGNILNTDENVEDEDDYGFIGSFFKKALIIVDDNTKL